MFTTCFNKRKNKIPRTKDDIIYKIIELHFDLENYNVTSVFITINSIFILLHIFTTHDFRKFLKKKQLSKDKFYFIIQGIVKTHTILQHHPN